MKNESAFPQIESEYYEGAITEVSSYGGLSKREYIAIAAMTGIIATEYNKKYENMFELTAIDAFRYADEMIKYMEGEK